MPWDVFISHASEDKDVFVRPLAEALTALGVKVWYDEFTLKLGDSLSQSIDEGLAQSKFGIVVLSRHFLVKPWPKHELRGLVTREIDGRAAIVPIWYQVTRQEVSEFSPTLADKLAVRTSDSSAIDIALQLLAVIRPDLYQQHPRSYLEKIANGEALAQLQNDLMSVRQQLSEFQCPFCKSQLIESVEVPIDHEERDWGIVRTFECGYREFDGEKQRLCPDDPTFPNFAEYELSYTKRQGAGSQASWICHAVPRTDAAHLVPLPETIGPTQQYAAAEMEREYDQRAKPWTRPFGVRP